MPIRSRAAAAAVHILTALCAAVGVVLQCGFFGGRLNLAALQYFTLMSNILCAVYFAGAAVRTLRSIWRTTDRTPDDTALAIYRDVWFSSEKLEGGG